MALDLRQLRYLVAVGEEGHVTRAAERLGIQQPPLSQQIKAMEAQLGFQLFRRKPRGVELTESGRVLFEEARAIMLRLAQAERDARRVARGEQGQLRVGVAPTAPFHPLVPGVLRAFREAWPAVTVTLDECLSRQAVQGLREARLDAAFLRAEPPAEPGLAVDRLLDEPMVAAVPAAHPLAVAVAPRPLRDFAAESFIAFARVEGPGMFDATLAACLKAGFTPRLGQEAPRITSTLSLVAAGLGVALVPASLRRVQMDGVAYCELAPCDRPSVPLCLATRREPGSPILRNFATLVRRAGRAPEEAATSEDSRGSAAPVGE
ncbi:LysR substrate-binding domain-containing protein [Stella sp.]|uniref:LysR substrate-binding domain-containing protein n=1 Tax=Stella sp. TaxID=2912054 RepID=UPI0035B33CE4